MFEQDFSPIGDSLGLSAIFAALPLITIFILLGALKTKAQWAALASLGVSIVVAIAVYGMPVGQTLLATSEGAVFGFFPIMWIVLNAIRIYTMTVSTGHFDVLRRSFGFEWPGLEVVDPDGEAVSATAFTCNWLPNGARWC